MMMRIITAVSALALSLAFAASAQAGCDSGCGTTGGASNTLNIFANSPVATISLVQKSWGDNFGQISTEGKISKVYVDQDAGGQNIGKVVVDALESTVVSVKQVANKDNAA